MRWYKNWLEFRICRSLGKLGLIFFALLLYVIIKYWYIGVPLLVIFFIVGLKAAEEEEQQQNFRIAKRNALHDRIIPITRRSLSSYALLSIEEYESLIKEYSYIMEQLQNDELFAEFNKWYGNQVQTRLNLCKDLYELAKQRG